MSVILLIDILLILGLGVPVFVFRRKWDSWADRTSHQRKPFKGRRRFGLRSWAARSFILDTPREEVVCRINTLTEMDWTASPGDETGLGALAPMLGNRKIETGIKIDWLDDETAEFQARQHAEWPPMPDDGSHLPLRQRQRLAERVMLHVSPESGGRTRVSYELQLPSWVLITSAAAVVLLAWITWGLWALQSYDLYTQILNRHGLQPAWLLRNTAVLWVLTAWVLHNLMRIFRLQNISLLDNLIATFGPVTSR